MNVARVRAMGVVCVRLLCLWGAVRVCAALGCCKAETDPAQRGVVLMAVARWA